MCSVDDTWYSTVWTDIKVHQYDTLGSLTIMDTVQCGLISRYISMMQYDQLTQVQYIQAIFDRTVVNQKERRCMFYGFLESSGGTGCVV
jgi:hypothetical protein